MVFCSAVITKNFHFIETRLLPVLLVRLPSEVAPLHCGQRTFEGKIITAEDKP